MVSEPNCLTAEVDGNAVVQEGMKLSMKLFQKFLNAYPTCHPVFVWMENSFLGEEGLRSFSDLQKRLGRKSPSASIIKKHPVRFQVYDLLRINGVDIRGKPFLERRKKLESLFASVPKHLPIGLSESVNEKGWEELKLRRGSRESVGSKG